MLDLTAIILTYDEEKNIEHCINSIKGLAKRIVVIDSYSTDKTVEIAKAMGAEVFQHEFVNQAKQYVYGEKIADIKTKWILRLDADERLTEASAKEMEQLCTENNNTDVNGIIIRFKVNFMGKDLKHGGIYPLRTLRVYKNGKACMEDRSMDEHIILTEGRSIEMKNDCLHCDYKNISVWIDKHNKYSTKEAEEYFKNLQIKDDASNLNKSAKIKRYVKYNLYYKLPMGMRAYLYYIYRYYFKLGFLDGREGKIFAFLQAYWYRYLVDAKIYEKEKKTNGTE
jgi:glycosyltransferase involved in cell wall biosynthesis